MSTSSHRQRTCSEITRQRPARRAGADLWPAACACLAALATGCGLGTGGAAGAGSDGGAGSRPDGRDMPADAPVVHQPGDERMLYIDANGAVTSAFTDGTDAHELSPPSLDCKEPAWSPDGTRIVFAAADDSDHEQLYAMAADGSALTLLFPWDRKLFSDVRLPSWSVDDVIAFAAETDFSSGPVVSIYRISPTGDDLAPMQVRGSNDAPAWSPGGLPLAVSSGAPGGAHELWLWRGVDNSHDLGVGFLFGDLLPAWAPDGTWLAYTHSDPGGLDFGVYRIGADGSGEVELAAPGNMVWRPTISRDGGTIAYDVFDNNLRHDVYTLDVATGATHLLLTSAADPAYQP
jgi:Tol biopolymer transport system component